jgi:hypothetical protein
MKKILFSISLILFVAVSAISAVKTCRTCQDEANKCAIKCSAVSHGWARWGGDNCRTECRKEFKSCTKGFKAVCELPKSL